MGLVLTSLPNPLNIPVVPHLLQYDHTSTCHLFHDVNFCFLTSCIFYQSKNGLELVPRPSYSPANLANSDGQIAADWNSRGQHAVQAGTSAAIVQNAELNNMGRYSPLVSR